MGAKEAIPGLFEVDASVKAIVSSGFLDDPVMMEFERYGFCAAAAKPYRMAELNTVLIEVLKR
jgi:two-component system cell cycle sensor histidine kinase/response regulator CckA